MHKSVADCAKTLNKLCVSKNIKLKWVKAHFGYVGNEFADEQAKLGTRNKENKVFIPPPLSWAKLKIKQAIDNEWMKRFQATDGLRQTKLWLSRNDMQVTNYLLNLDRK